MARVLLTAFEPYDIWRQNASWLALVELTRDLPSTPELITRLYPVDFDGVRERIEADLALGFDYVIHTGQAPGRTRVELEVIALNRRTNTVQDAPASVLEAGGPTAYESDFPAERACEQLRQAGIPAAVSCHAGTYLCNAALYFSLHHIAQHDLPTQALFVHIPLDTRQVAPLSEPLASLPAEVAARGLRVLLESTRRLSAQ